MSKLLSMYEKDDRPELSYPGGPVRELDCDVVVVGGGGSGLSAAVRAAQLGKRVIVVEKMDRLGGNSRLAGGMLSTTSKFQREKGLEDKTEHYIKTAYEQHKYTLDPRIFRRYIQNTGTYYEWIADLGLDPENTRYVMDAVVMVQDRLEPGPLNHPSYGPGLMGSNVVDTLKRHLEPLGITCLMAAKVRELLADENGVNGVLADGQTESYHIHAGAVILSSGGFGGNMEMLQRFVPQYFASDNYFSHYCLLSSTGDGITMAEKLGAEIGKNISVGVEAMNHIPGAFSIQCVCKVPRGIIVNKQGRRFIAEDHFRDGEWAMDLQPDGVAYYLFRESGKAALFAEGQKQAAFGDRQPQWEEFLGDLEREIADGKVLYAQTPAELAKQLGCEADTLEQTLAEYERFCQKGHDDELLKEKEHLISLGEGPLYACRLTRKFDVTMGGVSINHHLQVVRPDQTPIRGLYATGDVASGWMGKDYGPLFSSFAWALNSGYLAGEEAAGLYNSDPL